MFFPDKTRDDFEANGSETRGSNSDVIMAWPNNPVSEGTFWRTMALGSES
jgi:hypothetical protein